MLCSTGGLTKLTNPPRSTEISENVEERINLQKALFEIEDITLQNRNELELIESAIARAGGGQMAPDEDLETLRVRSRNSSDLVSRILSCSRFHIVLQYTYRLVSSTCFVLESKRES